ncbi:MAG: alpha/beta hydrolase [Acidobacteriaceae bacterium]|nr:alpha/beta hydrolase [Acidobacteriaceae bacterium]MBV9779581.1 alpha/beta hydrolase [Acidobacteriaceae bacterium]
MAEHTVTGFEQGSVRGFLHKPSDRPEAGLVLTHGAGGNCEVSLLVAVANAFCRSGFVVLRCDLPFRQRKRFGPPLPATAAQDRAGLGDAAAVMREMQPGRTFLGGQSYGGRQASMVASEQPDVAGGLLLLSYPLHPPGKTDQLRTSHFPKLRVPALFVQGSKDPFGSLKEMSEALRLIPTRTELIGIEGAGHELARGKFDIEQMIVKNFRSLMD